MGLYSNFIIFGDKSAFLNLMITSRVVKQVNSTQNVPVHVIYFKELLCQISALYQHPARFYRRNSVNCDNSKDHAQALQTPLQLRDAFILSAKRVLLINNPYATVCEAWYVPQEIYLGQWQEGRKISFQGPGCSAPHHGEAELYFCLCRHPSASWCCHSLSYTP